MISVNCREWISGIVECSRSGSQPGASLQLHLKSCSKCAERWEDEQRLSGQLCAARGAASGRRSSEARRGGIMRRVALAPRRRFQPAWKLVLAAAAVLILSIALGYFWRNGGLLCRAETGLRAVAVGRA